MKILFVCTGNTCRSPMAQGIFKALLVKENIEGIECDSAGISAATGEKATDQAIKVLREIDIDLKKHKSKNIFDIDINSIDLFVVMNLVHYEILKTMDISVSKIYVLNSKVEDPYGGNIEVYRKCRDQVNKALKTLFKHIKSKGIKGKKKEDKIDKSKVTKVKKEASKKSS